jgi:hypothetical protein
MNAQVQTANFVVDWKEDADPSNKDGSLKSTKIKWAENINQFEERANHHHLKTTPKKKSSSSNLDELQDVTPD